jgi:hypothetical protein
MAKEAERRHRGNAAIEVIWGRLVNKDELDLSALTAEEEQWAAYDIERLDSAPQVLAQLPSRIDLLILDGGEFSTFAEYEKLKDRVSEWIVLDDTRTRKCRRIVQAVESGLETEFVKVWESGDRNGVMILKRLASRADSHRADRS